MIVVWWHTRYFLGLYCICHKAIHVCGFSVHCVLFRYCIHVMYFTLQIRDELPELKAIVQYKGELSQDYPGVYNVCITRMMFLSS